jgi:hypothetical protein
MRPLWVGQLVDSSVRSPLYQTAHGERPQCGYEPQGGHKVVSTENGAMFSACFDCGAQFTVYESDHEKSADARSYGL